MVYKIEERRYGCPHREVGILKKVRIVVKAKEGAKKIRRLAAKVKASTKKEIKSTERKQITPRIKQNRTERIIERIEKIEKPTIIREPIVKEKVITEKPEREKVVIVPVEKDISRLVPIRKPHTDNFGGIDIPEIKDSVKEEIEELTDVERRNINIKYPLVPRNPKKGQKVMAYAHIHWDDKIGNLIYEVVEPKIGEKDKKQIMVIKEYIEDKINIIFDEINKKEALEYLDKKLSQAFKYFGIFDKEKREVLRYYIFRDFTGLEKIDAIFKDPHIEDISCDGVGIPIFVYHKDNRIGSIATNIKFDTKEELDEFVMKLAEKCKKSISTLKPLLDGSLPDGSRVQATLGSDIAQKGSNFTIRKFPEMPLTPTDMLIGGTMDLTIATYLWMAIENSSSVLISGGTATGKTSLLNAVSLFIPKEAKIVSIEDTAEIRLVHPNWVPEVARSSLTGSVTMFDLLRESLRQRPDYIIVGEVRGKEAYVLFQQMATGHPGISTIHAENFDKLLDRLTTPPIELPPSLIENLNIIVFLKRIKYKNRYIRRISEVIEVLGFDRETNSPITRRVFYWDPKTDSFKIGAKSYVLEKIRSMRGMTIENLKTEFRDRAKLLKWLAIRKINDYRIFTRVIDLYKMNKEDVLMRIEAEI